MAGGGASFAITGKHYPGKLTAYVWLSCLIAATGGLIFGYDLGISGGVTSMDTFLKKFFPSVYNQEIEDTTTNQYCKFDSQLLTAFTSSLYLAALVASLAASAVTRMWGRKISMIAGGVVFLIGAALNGAAQNVLMLIFGRILLGIGIGFANQSVPVYLSEMAPARHRGMLNMLFQLMITVGILVANFVNYGTNRIKGGWGWRLSLALAAIPAAIITFGSLLLPETPNSLIDRGHNDKALQTLRRVRGTDDVNEEYNDLVVASKESKKITHPWSNILKRKYRAPLTMAIMIPFFQQFTGMNVIQFYAPVLFKTIGFGNDASLLSSAIIGTVNTLATFVSIFTVDKVGRRALYLEGGVQMLICQIIVGTLIGIKFGTSGVGSMSKVYAYFVVFFICVFVAGFAWSWGPLGWLVPSEIFPLEIRSAGQAINVSVNMFFTFIIAQAFLSMLCHLKFGSFYFFAGWVVMMTIFIYFLLPETKNVPIEEMVLVWKSHWFWGQFIGDDEVHVGKSDKQRATQV